MVVGLGVVLGGFEPTDEEESLDAPAAVSADLEAPDVADEAKDGSSEASVEPGDVVLPGVLDESVLLLNPDAGSGETVADGSAPEPLASAPRRSCETIRGTEYSGPDERDWFLENCVVVAVAAPVSEAPRVTAPSAGGTTPTTPSGTLTSASRTCGLLPGFSYTFFGLTEASVLTQIGATPGSPPGSYYVPPRNNQSVGVLYVPGPNGCFRGVLDTDQISAVCRDGSKSTEPLARACAGQGGIHVVFNRIKS
jgi:hypothetical protein